MVAYLLIDPLEKAPHLRPTLEPRIAHRFWVVDFNAKAARILGERCRTHARRKSKVSGFGYLSRGACNVGEFLVKVCASVDGVAHFREAEEVAANLRQCCQFKRGIINRVHQIPRARDVAFTDTASAWQVLNIRFAR